MAKITNFTEGRVFKPLIKFATPVLLAMFLQVMYGAVDLLIVGQFATSADVSSTATGAQVLLTLMFIVNGLAMGITIFMGQKIGEKKHSEIGRIVGSGVGILLVLSAILTILLTTLPRFIASLMHSPPEAFNGTVNYIRICGCGTIFLVGYNLISSIFRGIGDSKTPLMTVSIACVINIILDLILVANFGLGVVGAAIATVFAQTMSVILSMIIIKKRGLPFEFTRKDINLDKKTCVQILKFGAPIALQDGLVNVSFLAITAIVNRLGVTASAGLGITERLAGFIVLFPSSMAQSLSAFSAQNFGAKQYRRARKGLRYAIVISFSVSLIIGYMCFFHGDLLSSMFSKDSDVIAASWDYMKAYALDCVQVCFLFSMIGFFNGFGKTTFVMIQGIFGAFCVRIPVSYYMSTLENTSLFYIGLATPISSFFQIILCMIYYIILYKKYR